MKNAVHSATCEAPGSRSAPVAPLAHVMPAIPCHAWALTKGTPYRRAHSVSLPELWSAESGAHFAHARSQRHATARPRMSSAGISPARTSEVNYPSVVPALGHPPRPAPLHRALRRSQTTKSTRFQSSALAPSARPRPGLSKPRHRHPDLVRSLPSPHPHPFPCRRRAAAACDPSAAPGRRLESLSAGWAPARR